MSKKLLRENELCEQFGFKVRTIRNDRTTHQRIPFIKIGEAVYYDPDKVQAALDGMSFPKTARKQKSAAESRTRRAESEAA